MLDDTVGKSATMLNEQRAIRGADFGNAPVNLKRTQLKRENRNRFVRRPAVTSFNVDVVFAATDGFKKLLPTYTFRSSSLSRDIFEKPRGVNALPH